MASAKPDQLPYVQSWGRPGHKYVNRRILRILSLRPGRPLGGHRIVTSKTE